MLEKKSNLIYNSYTKTYEKMKLLRIKKGNINERKS